MIANKLKKNTIQSPQKIAIYCDPYQLSYLDLYEKSLSIYDTFEKIFKNSKESSSRIGILLPNCIAFITAFIATTFSNIIPLIYNPDWPINQLKQVLEFSHPELLLIHESFYKMPNSESLHPNLLIFDDNDLKNTIIRDINHTSPPHPNMNNEMLFVGFTSGTTSLPKGFIRSKNSWMESFAASTNAFNLQQNNHFIIPGPLAHGLSFYAAIEALNMEASIVIQKQFNLLKLCQTLQTTENSVLECVPTVLRKISQAAAQNNLSFNQVSTILTAAEKLDEKTENSTKSIFPNAVIFEYYGASELGFISLREINNVTLPSHSVGKIFPAVSVKILDDDKNECPANTPGTIWIKSKFIMTSYLGMYLKTSFEQENDWATVGDMGYFDEEKYLYIVGRKDDMINTAGYNVYPHEVEQVFKKINFIKEAYVFSLPDKIKGQIVGAALVFNQSAMVTKAMLKELCKDSLNHYKFPKQIYRLSEIPLTTTGKVSRAFLQKKILKKDTDLKELD